jgi:hypothetical protein
MKSPPPLQDKKQRLGILWQYDALCPPPKEAGDDLPELSAQIGAVPIGLILLADESGQWFKSQVNWTVFETASDSSFCGRAIHQSELLIRPNAASKTRLANHSRQKLFQEEKPNQRNGFCITLPATRGLGGVEK